MTKLRIVLALLLALVLPVAAEAVTDGCLPLLPTTPTPPVVAENVSWGFGSPSDRLRFEIWRQPCLDGSGDALLLRASPLAPGPGYFCDSNLADPPRGPSVRYCRGEDLQNPSGYCNGLYIPKTFLLDVEPSGGVLFNESRAFTLVGVGSPESFQIAVPASGTTPPPQPHRPGPRLHDMPPRRHARLPGRDHQSWPADPRGAEDGRAPTRWLGRDDPGRRGGAPHRRDRDSAVHRLRAPGSGPSGSLRIEAALLDPALGVTISEDSAAFTVAP